VPLSRVSRFSGNATYRPRSDRDCVKKGDLAAREEERAKVGDYRKNERDITPADKTLDPDA